MYGRVLLCLCLFVVAAPGAAKHVGCFKDTNSTDIPGVSITNKLLEKCIDFCMSEDYRAATHRKGCYCGQSFGQGRLPKGICYAYCPGTSAEECVGKYTNSVWFTGEEEDSESTETASTDASEDVSRQKRYPRQMSGNAQSSDGTTYLGGYDDEEEE